jgi:hypothetical protein
MAVAHPDWSGLERAIGGSLILRGSSDYEYVRKPAMARFEGDEACGGRAVQQA